MLVTINTSKVQAPFGVSLLRPLLIKLFLTQNVIDKIDKNINIIGACFYTN